MPSRFSVRFGPFELNAGSGELLKQGRRLRLQEQPLQVLSLLLEHPGEVVTREQLKQRLWPSDTFVDFDHGLNAAVRRLREVLGDEADHPLFIETLPRHGYRFLAPVVSDPQETDKIYQRSARFDLWRWLLLAGTVAVVAGLGLRLGYRLLLRGPGSSSGYSVAVLPFENLTRLPEDEYLVDSLNAELIHQLSRTHGLRVISRQSVMQYKGTIKTLPQIARELRVQAIVQGSVLHEDQKVRITLQLIRAAPEQNLWAESYEHELKDVIELERNIAKDVATQVEKALAQGASSAGR